MILLNMNKIVPIIGCLLFIASFSFAQKTGIVFTKKTSWSDILKEAKDQNKLVFLDAYTTWCGPCKKMDRDVYPQKMIGDFYNKNFVNVKMDMEKTIGPEIGQRYGISAYPTFVFVTPDGKVAHRSAGYHTVPQFLKLGQDASNPEKQMASLEKRYINGDRDPGLLYKLTQAKWEAMDGSHTAVAEEYLKTQDDWGTNENKQFIFTFTGDANSEMFNYMIDNRADFEKTFGQRQVTQRVQDLIYGSIQDSKDESSLTQIDKLYKKVYPNQAEQLSAKFRMSFYRQAGDRANYAKSAVKYFKKYKDNPDELNDVSWTFYEAIKDKKMLKKAVKWSKRSVKLDDNYYNNDTLAALYFKIGKKKKAMGAAKRAIGLAKAKGEDYTSTDELLQKIIALSS